MWRHEKCIFFFFLWTSEENGVSFLEDKSPSLIRISKIVIEFLYYGSYIGSVQHAQLFADRNNIFERIRIIFVNVTSSPYRRCMALALFCAQPKRDSARSVALISRACLSCVCSVNEIKFPRNHFCVCAL